MWVTGMSSKSAFTCVSTTPWKQASLERCIESSTINFSFRDYCHAKKKTSTTIDHCTRIQRDECKATNSDGSSLPSCFGCWISYTKWPMWLNWHAWMHWGSIISKIAREQVFKQWCKTEDDGPIPRMCTTEYISDVAPNIKLILQQLTPCMLDPT